VNIDCLLAGKNLYNNEHVAIKLVSPLCYMYLAVCDVRFTNVGTNEIQSTTTALGVQIL
jgi:hypothetical protein